MKRITVVLLSLLLVLNMGLMCVMAETNQAFVEKVYQEEKENLHILCAVPHEDTSETDFEVMLGTDILPVLSVSPAGQKGIPKTVYCLVDISGSMKGRMEQVKEILFTISSGLNEQDNLVIGKMGNQITDTDFLSSQEEIDAEIEDLRYTGEDTDLYSGLIHGLRFLQQQSEVHRMSALVVLSDGCDDQGDGSTWKEAYEAVGKADIPVYTAAMILSADDYEQAKELGSFARNSAGGIHYPKSDSSGSKPLAMTGEEIGTEILAALDSTVDICVDLEGISRTGKDTYILSVTYRDEAGKLYEDRKEIGSKDLKLAEASTDIPETSTAPGDESEVIPEPEKKSRLLWLIGGAGILLAVLIAAVAVVRTKRKKAQEEEQRKQEEERLRLEAERLEKERAQKEKQQQILAQQKAQEEALRRAQEEYNAIPRLAVRLAAIGLPDKVHRIELVKGHDMTIGRNEKAKIVLDSQDTKLSGIHFTMMWDGRKVYAWDSMSKNGTSINGVVVNQLGKIAVKPGDSLRVGSYEYRLYWEE